VTAAARRFTFCRSLAQDSGFAGYARLLEEAARLASADAGYPPGWYSTHATAWVIRRSTIECGRAIPCGVDLEIVTWVADFRRVRSYREYEVRLPGESAAVLTAQTDWVYVDARSGRPRRIPEEMMRAFVPEGDALPLYRPVLEIPTPPSDAFTVERIVEEADVDALDHVNNAAYLGYVEAATRAMLGKAFRARGHDVEYLEEARSGERLRCRTWRLGSFSPAVETAAEIRRASDETLFTRVRSAWVP
jgi:acyl-CoA thioester hydrolase